MPDPQIKIIFNPDGTVTKILNRPPIENIVYGGGGPRLVAYVGTINSLHKRELYNQIKCVAGSSSGALVAAIIAGGFTAPEAMEFLKNVDILSLLDDSTAQAITNKEVLSLIKKFGLHGYIDSGERMLSFFKQTLQNKLKDLETKFPTNHAIKEAIKKNGNATFADLKKIQQTCPEAGIKDLIITGTKKTNKIELVLFDHIHNPHKSIAEAARASISIPNFFQDVINKDENAKEIRITDGGCTNNLPTEPLNAAEYLSQDEFLLKITGDFNQNLCTIAFKVDDQEDLKQITQGQFVEILNQSFTNKIINHFVSSISCNSAHSSQLDKGKMMLMYSEQTCVISSCGVGLFSFDLSPSKKEELILEGEKTADKWLDEYFSEDNALEKKVYSGFYELCEDMPIAELQKFCKLLEKTISQKIFVNQKNSDAINLSEFIQLAHQVLKQKLTTHNLQREQRDLNKLLKDQELLLSILMVKECLKQEIKCVLITNREKINNKNSERQESLVELADHKFGNEDFTGVPSDSAIQLLKFQNFLIDKLIELLNDSFYRFKLSDKILNTHLYQTIIPILQINNKYINFIDNTALRCEVDRSENIFRKLIVAIYFSFFTSFKIKENTLDIDLILNKLNIFFKDFEKIIVHIDTFYYAESNLTKAKFLLTKLIEKYPTFIDQIQKVASENNITDYKNFSLSERESPFPLFHQFSKVLASAVATKNVPLIYKFIAQQLETNLEALDREWFMWQENIIQKHLNQVVEEIYGESHQAAHPLEFSDASEVLNIFRGVPQEILNRIKAKLSEGNPNTSKKPEEKYLTAASKKGLSQNGLMKPLPKIPLLEREPTFQLEL